MGYASGRSPVTAPGVDANIMSSESAYRVLARTYRPHNFDDLVGQDVLVRTLSNAFQSGRIAHAFLLTGIRGIGKTTTARIIARGLNCIGSDGNSGPTTTPCGECPNCKMILEDRHVDVIEMDAASRTGVDDIRELIDTVHYAPTSARYKVYIIDEVHMLSKNAFNALLKTLEEPPQHVKFIFATTELHKIPVTIVSRCQRFDLRRLDSTAMQAHLRNIAGKENVTIDDESLLLIATAAEGSVRDALSLLDQAIALGTDAGGKVEIAEAHVRDMLGLADKTQAFTLLEAVFSGDAKQAIEQLRSLYTQGADPLLMMQNLLELVHYMTRIRVAEELVHNVTYSDIEQQKAKTIAEKLDMPALTRSWQMLLKGLHEVKSAPHPLAAAEMILVRLSYASTLPSPADVIRQLDSANNNTPNASGEQPPSGSPAPGGGSGSAARPSLAIAAQTHALPQATPDTEATPQALAKVESYLDIVELFSQEREAILHSHLVHDVRLVSYTQGKLELHPVAHVPADFAARVQRHLSDWTGKRWSVSFSDAEGEPTLHEQALAAKRQAIEYAKSHPHVTRIMEYFPDADVVDVIE